MRGETRMVVCSVALVWHFNPLPSCEGRLCAACHNKEHPEFQSTPLMRGETRTRTRRSLAHAHFNPLPSCEGRRSANCRHAMTFRFQSTPLMRGETLTEDVNGGTENISIHSPHARGDKMDDGSWIKIPISIHSPHARGDKVLRVNLV